MICLPTCQSALPYFLSRCLQHLCCFFLLDLSQLSSTESEAVDALLIPAFIICCSQKNAACEPDTKSNKYYQKLLTMLLTLSDWLWHNVFIAIFHMHKDIDWLYINSGYSLSGCFSWHKSNSYPIQSISELKNRRSLMTLGYQKYWPPSRPANINVQWSCIKHQTCRWGGMFYYY